MNVVTYHPKHNPANLNQGWRESSPLYDNGRALGPYVIWRIDGRYEIHAPQKHIIVGKHDTIDAARKHLEELFNNWKEANKDYVYFIGAELTVGAMVKIGTTRDLKRRLGQIQSSSPVIVKILGVVEGDRNTEIDYHMRFAVDKSHGEWFTASARMVREIKRLNRIAPAGKTFSRPNNRQIRKG
ncbi:GIY-YIG nuclease family protein [Parasphingorhabdus sp. JC815]|uniref:GIY-YIG nuclease family protein n=1 Tax=Parasphingorhabdus sp. JC815 TaxID=3232140 RepID=UPI003459C4FB